MPIPEDSQPINRLSMREEVFNTLLKWIMDGVLRPGEKILDKDLAKRLGVSRTPVREALRRLEDKEPIESSANRWTRVAEVSIEEPEKIYPIIWTLEELAVSQAIELLTTDDFKRMADINRTLKQAIQDGDPVMASWADVEFHRVYIEKSGNCHLAGILHELKIKFRRVEVTYFSGSVYVKDSLVEHELILDALKSRDLEKTQALIRKNWQNSLKRLKEIERVNNLDELQEQAAS